MNSAYSNPFAAQPNTSQVNIFSPESDQNKRAIVIEEADNFIPTEFLMGDDDDDEDNDQDSFGALGMIKHRQDED